MRKNPDLRGPILASAWRSFSPMAAIATVVLLATGLYESGRHIPDLRSVTSTVYGAAVVGKTVMVAVALVLAAINTLLVNPPLAAPARRILGWPVGSPVPLRRFTTVVVAEVLILIVAVGTASLLTSVPTAREIGTALRQTTVHTANVDGLFVTFEEVPAGPDQSRLIVRARSTHKLQPAPVSGVSVLLAGPTGTTTSLALERLEPGRYEADTAKPAPGSWTASVALQRDGLPVAVTQIRWTASVPSPEGVRPLEAVTTGLAVLLLTATLGAVGFTRRRRRRAVRSIPLVRDLMMRERTGSHP